MPQPQILLSFLLSCCAFFASAQCPILFEVELSIDAPYTLACGDTFQIKAIGPVTDSILQIAWTTNGNILSGAQTLEPIANDIGVYEVEVSAIIDNERCIATDRIIVESSNREPLNVDFSEAINCNRQEVTLRAIDDLDRSVYLYEWTTSFGSITSDASLPDITVNNGGVYNLQRTDLMGNCPVLVPVIVFDQRLINFSFEFIPPTCEQRQGMIVFTSINGGSGALDYSIDGGMSFEEDPNFSIQTGGNYSLVVRDNDGGCLVTKDTTLVFLPIVQAVNLPVEIPLKKGATYTISLNIGLPDSLIESIQWLPEEGLSCTDCPNPSVMVTRNQVYEVMVTDINGCIAQASTQIAVTKSTDLYIPAAFSPNLDGINERFTLYANTRKISAIQELLIFDRYGSLIFHLDNFLPNDDAVGWDGQFKGQDMPTGVYAFFARIDYFNEPAAVVSGEVTLIR